MLRAATGTASLQAEHGQHEHRPHRDHRHERDRGHAGTELDAARLVGEVAEDRRQLEPHHEEHRALEDQLDRAPVLHVRHAVLR